MTDFYSEHFGPAIGEVGHFTTKHTIPQLIESGQGHSRLRHMMGPLQVPAATDVASGDVIRFLKCKSSDRIVQLFFSMDADWGATSDWNIGVWLDGSDSDGAVVDADLFQAAIDWSGAIARVDYFTGASLLNTQRGFPLWELLGLSEDPGVLYNICVEASSDNLVVDAAVDMLAELIYISGD